MDPTIESTCASGDQERVDACFQAIDGGYREEDEAHYDPVEDTKRAQEMGEQFYNYNLDKGKRVNFDPDAYADTLAESNNVPLRWKDGMQAACAGLDDSGCPSADEGWEAQHEWLHENGITSIDPDTPQSEFDTERKPLYNSHTSLIFFRIEEDFTFPGYHEPIEEDDDDGNRGNGGGNGNGPTCDNGMTVISVHVTGGDDGCRPPNCPFGRDANGWCAQPTNNNPPVLYVLGGGDVDEGDGTVGFRVRVSHRSTQDVWAEVATQDGTATAGTDFVSVSRDIHIPAGFTVHHVSVTILNDSRYEGDESFTMRISDPSSNAELSTRTQAEATIVDDDIPAAPGAPRNLSLACSLSGGRFSLTAGWDAPSGERHADAYWVKFSDSEGWESRTLKRNGESNTSAEFPTRADRDRLAAGEYWVSVTPNLSDGTAGIEGTASTQCLPTVSLDDTTLTVAEGESIDITASLDVLPSGTAAVWFNITGGTRSVGSCSVSQDADFYQSNSRFAFTGTRTATATLTACDDTDMIDESITLTLTTTGINGLQLGSPTTVVVTITDAGVNGGDDDDTSILDPILH